MTAIIFCGFDGITYVQTVRMRLADNGSHYEQVPVNVRKDEPRQSEHVACHPLGERRCPNTIGSASSKRAVSRHIWNRCCRDRRSHRIG
jgi:hypothetical protein